MENKEKMIGSLLATLLYTCVIFSLFGFIFCMISHLCNMGLAIILIIYCFIFFKLFQEYQRIKTIFNLDEDEIKKELDKIVEILKQNK